MRRITAAECSPVRPTARSKANLSPVWETWSLAPSAGGVYPIVQILPRGMTMDGKPPAFEGDKTACGASLIASQSIATAQPISGAGGQASPIANHETASDEPGPYRGKFQVLDETTGKPIPNHPYTLHASDGNVISGQSVLTRLATLFAFRRIKGKRPRPA